MFTFQDCATITRGTSEALVVNTTPPGAKVSIERYIEHYRVEDSDAVEAENKKTTDKKSQEQQKPPLIVKDSKFGVLTGVTPTSFKLVRRGHYELKIEKEGYETASITVNCQVSDAGSVGIAGNVCLGGCIGAGVDAASGGMDEFVPNPVEIVLAPLQKKGEIVDTVAERLNNLKMLKKQGHISEEEYIEKRKKILDGL